jgi:hypothetical protein
VNTDAPWPTAEQAGARVLGIQTKLHRWDRHSPPAWARGEPDAWERARPVRRCGPGKRATRNGDTAPRPDPYKAGPAGGRLRRPASAGRTTGQRIHVRAGAKTVALRRQAVRGGPR